MAPMSHPQVLRLHADVCAGLQHLCSMVSALPAAPGQPPLLALLAPPSGGGGGGPALLQPEAVVEAVAQCELRLQSALGFIRGMPKAAKLLEDMSSNPDLNFTPAS